jgi:hypothetical protein
MRGLGAAPRPRIGRVIYHALCGEIDAAAEWYERSIADRDPFALVWAPNPLLRGLHESPHWPRLLAKMSMPEKVLGR